MTPDLRMAMGRKHVTVEDSRIPMNILARQKAEKDIVNKTSHPRAIEYGQAQCTYILTVQIIFTKTKKKPVPGHRPPDLNQRAPSNTSTTHRSKIQTRHHETKGYVYNKKASTGTRTSPVFKRNHPPPSLRFPASGACTASSCVPAAALHPPCPDSSRQAQLV